MVSRAAGSSRPRRSAGAVRTAAAIGALLTVGAAGAAAQVRVDARLEPARIALGGTAELVIEVSSSGIRADVGEPTLPDLGPIEVLGQSREWGVRMAGTDVTRHTTFRYVLRPAAAGTLRIDPVRVTVDGVTHRTAVRRILVVDAAGIGPAWRGPSENPADLEGPPAIFAVTRVDRPSAWVGEQVTLTFTFYHDPRVPLSDSPDYDPPDTPGFWRIELDDAPRVGIERIGGRSYHVQRFRYALFPLRAGELEVGPATVRVVEPDPARWWLPGEPRTIRTEPLVIDARPLPVPAPADFDGAVGRFRLSGGLVDRRAAVGSPVRLELTVDGTGNPSSVPPPTLPDWPDVAVRAPAVEAATDLRGRSVEGRKTFRWLLVPRAEGALDLGLARLAYFDPAAGTFSVDSLRLGEIRVEPGARDDDPAVAAGPTLWPARTPAAPRPAGLAGQGWYWGALAGPWLGWLAVLATRRARRSRPADRSRRQARLELLRATSALEAGGPAAAATAAIDR
ncbi:MAG TPA: BatD family protein, partial [Gemmatimonadota bacterium]|nr:BatD family protein [Gemmatimonadota bacterium]